MKKIFKRQSYLGFSLMEVTIAMALVSIVSVSVFQLSGLSTKDNRLLSLSRVAIDHRNRIMTNLKNPVSWQNTANYNSSFSCLAPGVSCNINPAAGSDGYYDFVVVGPDLSDIEKVTYDATDATSRISLASGKCAADLPNPHKECPLKFVARWKPICATYPCQNAQVEIKAELVYDFPGEVPFNVNKYSVKVTRDFHDTSIEAACAALNGTFNSTTGTCTPKYANQTCPPYQVISSVSSDGAITCKPVFSGQCTPANQLVAGITPTGQVQCGTRPTCAPTPTPTATATPTPTPTATAPPPDNCSETFCHLMKRYVCTRTNGVATQTMVGPCEEEHGGFNPCSQPYCGGSPPVVTPPAPINCVGSWGTCVDEGSAVYKQTYTITTPASGGGAVCPYATGDKQPCSIGNAGLNTPYPAQCHAVEWSVTCGVPCEFAIQLGTSPVVTFPEFTSGTLSVGWHGGVRSGLETNQNYSIYIKGAGQPNSTYIKKDTVKTIAGIGPLACTM